MKKLTTSVFTLLLAGSLSMAQDTGDKKPKAAGQPTAQSSEGKKATKTSKAHKGGKKHKKGSSGNAAAPPAQPK